MPAGYEELAGGYEHIKNSKIFSMANTKIVYLFIFLGNSVFCAVVSDLNCSQVMRSEELNA